jgi:asparagine synthase (glutamine-hydrolysing)
MISRIKRFAKKLLKRSVDANALSGLSDNERELVVKVRERNLTYLSPKKLASIVDTCNSIEAKEIEGIFLEAGCALGGSAIVISQIKEDSRPFSIFDVFGMIPPPTEEDSQDVHDRYRTIVEGKSKGLGGDQYYGYIANLFEVVQENLRSFGCDLDKQSVSLVKGLLQDTMHLDGPVAFAHIDVDWYDPVRTCLERVWPWLPVGGCVILDDYHDWGGCRKATDEFLRTCVGKFKLDDSSGALKIERTAS